MLLLLRNRPRLGEIDDDGDADKDTDGDAEEGQRAQAITPMALFLERDRVGFEEEVECAVDESHVDGHEDEDGFDDEHVYRAEKVLGEDLSHVDLHFVRFGVVGPVFGFVAELLRPSLQQDWGI